PRTWPARVLRPPAGRAGARAWPWSAAPCGGAGRPAGRGATAPSPGRGRGGRRRASILPSSSLGLRPAVEDGPQAAHDRAGPRVLVDVPATGGDGLVHGEHLAGHHRPVVAAYRGRGRLTNGPGGLAVHQRGGEGGGQRGGVPVRRSEERRVGKGRRSRGASDR